MTIPECKIDLESIKLCYYDDQDRKSKDILLLRISDKDGNSGRYKIPKKELIEFTHKLFEELSPMYLNNNSCLKAKLKQFLDAYKTVHELGSEIGTHLSKLNDT